MLAAPQLRAALLGVMRRGTRGVLSDTEFDSCALRIFAHQYENNPPYRKYCDRRARTPANVETWTDVPAVPTGAFKEVALVAGDPDGARLRFRTSGTTRGAQKRGVHYILDPALYEASLLPAFQTFVLHGADSMRMLSLIAPADDAPDSSLSYMISVVLREFGSAESGFYANADGIDFQGLNTALDQSNEPVCLLGTSLAYAHWMESLGDKRFGLPEGSRLMDTGGFKGESRAFTSDELRSRYQSVLGIPREMCINEYGMTELCSQYYDSDGIKRGPPWLRARVVNPEDLQPVPRGETGILQHFDLANLDSVSAVQTEDLARETSDGFVLLGRTPGAAPRGCSIAMDMLLSDAGS
jgi:hypothetical protein